MIQWRCDSNGRPRDGRFIFARRPVSDGPIKLGTGCQACQAEE